MANEPEAISESAIKDYRLLNEECGFIELPSLSLIVLTGDDRKDWLQGQVTNDVRGLDNGKSVSFCLCSATGQVQAVVDAWAVGDRIAMTLARETAPALLQRVDQMVILEDVVAEDATETYRLISVQGPAAGTRLANLLHLPSLDAGESRVGDARLLCLRSDRTGRGGWDIWIPATETEAYRTLTEAFPLMGREAYQVARLEAGIPLFGADMTERTLPPELGPAFEAKHVSYQKGCYMGQEVLMRIHSRGHTNRTWVGLVAEAPLEMGATVSHPERSDAGTVTSIGYSPMFGNIGAATLRNDFATEGGQVRVITERGEVEAEVRRMPLLSA